ncbi:hypothetical protein ACEQ6A_08815 [Rhizobium brockwellii]|uniref:hypothetical protein n=1 Tax=Rhizobium brockwellii TaxID=3019932 RepID=UPI003F97AE41
MTPADWVLRIEAGIALCRAAVADETEERAVRRGAGRIADQLETWLAGFTDTEKAQPLARWLMAAHPYPPRMP